jgi:hypothetical protein
MSLAISSGSHQVSEPVTHYRMHTYRPGNLRDEIPKEGGFGPPQAVTPWKKKNIINIIMDLNHRSFQEI